MNTVLDTFQGFYRAASRDPKLFEGKQLGKILALLVSVESRPGGPYYSDFPEAFSGEKKRICGRETNLAIDRFLALYDLHLPNLKEFLRLKPAVKKPDSAKEPMADPAEEAMMRDIRTALAIRLSRFDPEFRRRVTRAVERTIKGNADKQMLLMPYYMKKALGKKAGLIPKNILVSLGLANIFFWTAFIIYDDFWDEDKAADPKLLPVANLFARSYTGFFDTLFPKDAGRFRAFFHELMDGIDNANAWETSRCRAKRKDNLIEIQGSLPRYGNYLCKYHPVSGHILGPLALLVLCGHSLDSAEAKYLILYFRHYLIAMQLNDDMHDWEEDLMRGHLSTAVTLLIEDWSTENKNNNTNKKKVINLNRDMDKLRKVFWFVTLPRLARRVLSHTKKSHTALYAMKSIRDPAPLEYFIQINQNVAEKALKEQKQSAQLLNAYGKSYIS